MVKMDKHLGKGSSKYKARKVKFPFPPDWDKGRCNECLEDSDNLRAVEIKFNKKCRNVPAAVIKKLCRACFRMSLNSGEAYPGQKRILKEWEV